jgi:Spy/CpxP family protein refolding chaperone
MTKLRIAMTAIGLAAIISGAPRLHADDMDKSAKPEGHEGWGEGRGGRMKEELGLTDDQAKKMKEAHEADEKAMKPLMEKLKLDIDSLRLLVDKKAGDSDLKASLDTLKADHKAVEEQRGKQMEAMGAMLTPMQEAKMAVSMADRMMKGGMMGEHEGMGGHHDGDDKGKADAKPMGADEGKKADSNY